MRSPSVIGTAVVRAAILLAAVHVAPGYASATFGSGVGSTSYARGPAGLVEYTLPPTVPPGAVASVHPGAHSSTLDVTYANGVLVFRPKDANVPVPESTVVVDMIAGDQLQQVAVRYAWSPTQTPIWQSTQVIGGALVVVATLGALMIMFGASRSRRPKRAHLATSSVGRNPIARTPAAPPPLRIDNPERFMPAMPLIAAPTLDDADDDHTPVSPISAEAGETTVGSEGSDLAGLTDVTDGPDGADVADGADTADSDLLGEEPTDGVPATVVLPRRLVVVERDAPLPAAPTGPPRGFDFAPCTQVKLEGEEIAPERRGDAKTVVPIEIDADRRTWSLEKGGLLAIGACSEKRSGRGEDADPSMVVALNREGAVRWMIAAYDGLGGAGSREVVGGQDTVYTEAYLASRLARAETERWFWQSIDADADDAGADQLAGAMRARFDLFAEETGAGSSTGIVSTLHRALPTTFVGVAGRGTSVDVMWAGDSRAYVLTPDLGLQQLTLDHVRRPDTMQQLRNGAPMSNVIEAHGSFRIDDRKVDTSDETTVHIVATDGMFDYIDTPGMLEWHILDRLEASTTPDEWVQQLITTVGERAGDDCSFAMFNLGYSSFADLQQAFASRHAWLTETQRAPFLVDGLSEEDHAAARDHAWELYAPNYEALMPVQRPRKEAS